MDLTPNQKLHIRLRHGFRPEVGERLPDDTIVTSVTDTAKGNVRIERIGMGERPAVPILYSPLKGQHDA